MRPMGLKTLTDKTFAMSAACGPKQRRKEEPSRRFSVPVKIQMQFRWTNFGLKHWLKVWIFLDAKILSYPSLTAEKGCCPDG